MEIRRQFHFPGEVADTLHADPQGSGAGAVALARQMAAQAADQFPCLIAFASHQIKIRHFCLATHLFFIYKERQICFITI
jgi:hypothetical protein